ncbi:MAG: hypothetical protein AAFW59_10265 [Pseudomonadota bacterium]
MSAADTLARLNAFFGEWREALEARALVRFEAGAVPHDALTPAAKADAFSARFGFQPIGFNWEMLDPSDDLTAPRSARGTMVEALTNDMLQTNQRWLGVEGALACANGFLGAFDPSELSVVSNHLNGLWYPISGASDEWSFAAMDDQSIALLVLAARG